MTNGPENKNERIDENKGEMAKPKKKKLIAVFRPQNSETGMVKPSQRPGKPAKKPADPASRPKKRPAAPAAAASTGASSGEKEAKDILKAAAESAMNEKTVPAAAEPVKKAAEPAPAAENTKPVTAKAQPEVKKAEVTETKAADTAAEKAKAPQTAAEETSTPAKAPAEKASAAPAASEQKKESTPKAVSALNTDKAISAGKTAESEGSTDQAKKAEPEVKDQEAPKASQTEAAKAPAAPEKAKEQVRGEGTSSEAASKGTASASSDENGARPRNRTENPDRRGKGTTQGQTRPASGQSQGTGRPASGERYAQGARRQAGTSAGNGTAAGRPAQGARPEGGYRNAGGSAQGRPSAGRSSEGRDGRSFGQRGTGEGGRYQSQGTGRSAGGQRGSFSQGGGSSFRPGSGPRPEAKPMEKEGRMKNERGSRNDRRNGSKPEKGDKFDRMERKGQASSRNNAHSKAPVKPAKAPAPVEEKIKSITIPETITIKDLADALKIQPAAIVKKLFMQGKMVTVNEEIDFAAAEEIAIDYDVICEKEVKVDVIEELLKEEPDAEETLTARPPVVCVMGHVDHGKTSLLDAIRDTHVIDREAGGITQHIGASVVECSGKKITFLDTPGHEAFTAMRMRGANSTDIAILVVAADDGVMPQTVEAINHAKAAGIEIIVAINKIDKPGANIDRVKQELTEYQLIPEDWGGSTVFCEVSAKTREGIDNLLEMILLTSEVLELKANPNRRARGLVIEAQLDKGRGPVATVLVQKGTLHVGDPVCAGSCYGKVRAMTDDKHRPVKEAGPSTPVEIIGFSGVPGAGEIIISPETEKEARNFAQTFITEGRERLIEDSKQKMSLDDLFSKIQSGTLKELNLIVKADVQGSAEAVKQSLIKLSNDEVVVKIIHSGVGAINESDVILASASAAIIIGFNVKLDPQAKSTADQEGVDIRLYSVIYDAINDVEMAMKGMLDPIYEEQIIGHGEIRQTFRASGIGTIAGSYVTDGVFRRGCKARITRDGREIFNGEVASLKRFKDDVKEVKSGYECGLVFDKFNDVREGDLIEAYAMVEVPR